ncbi:MULTISPECIES: hypothetical protein [unclassified Xanthobacter]|uniref:hypothetical protein n=1 Tax=unclassified Xanthobacter TaxID=2623496 RepID=UPI001F22496A|nr:MULTISPECIES: hypothetical protein [unclassified Xanthobacter]
MFVVVRSYGRYGRDFLHAWDDRWGTTCIGAEKLSMRFGTLEAANVAKSRAACLLMSGACGTLFTWSVAPASGSNSN